ncbi:MAG: nucleotidyl transferase AbiEii/AbiGii toxin family protein [candidate division WOR-3 bacterium]
MFGMIKLKIDGELFGKMKTLAREIGERFEHFYLSGGTAIMFKYKHRMSIDLDFFRYGEFSKRRLAVKLGRMFSVEDIEEGIDDINFIINGIRVSFVYFPFKNIKHTEKIDGIRIAHDYDLLLNKIYVAGRRIDPKDPYDFAFLYYNGKVPKDWSLIKSDFEKKFPSQSFELYMGALLNLEDYPQLMEPIKRQIESIRRDFISWVSSH